MNTAQFKTNNLWKYKKNNIESDFINESELVLMIKNKKLDAEDLIYSSFFKKWFVIKDTIYAFYL